MRNRWAELVTRADELVGEIPPDVAMIIWATVVFGAIMLAAAASAVTWE